MKKSFELWLDYLDMRLQEQAEEAKELARQQMQDAAEQQTLALQHEQQLLNIELLQRKAQAQAEADRRIATCRRVVQRLLHQQLTSAWNSFVESVKTSKQNRATVARVLGRMKHRG